jgi:hypothetical protein
MIVGSLVPLGVWAGLSIYKAEMLDFPAGVLFFIGLALGLKGYQSTLQVKRDTYEMRAEVETVKAKEGIAT